MAEGKMGRIRQIAAQIKAFAIKRKGSCITAALAVAALVFLVAFVDFETVGEHKEKKAKETQKRQEVLAKLESKIDVSGASVLPSTSAEGQTDLPALSGEALTDNVQTAAEQDTVPSEAEAPTPNAQAERNQPTQKQPAQNQAEQSFQAQSSKTASADTEQKAPGIAGQNGTIENSPASSVPVWEEDAYSIVQVKITCEKVINNPDLTSSVRLPADGILFEGKTVIKKGGSVLDALEAVCTDNGIAYINKASASGAYITSIAGLTEKDCGGYSGWKFKVNGVVGSRSANAHKLNENDQVEWYFATTYTE